MGKSDDFVFPFYRNLLMSSKIGFPVKSTAFLGFVGPNKFTKSISTISSEFFDLQLGNFDINASWNLPKKYDLIICTRCCYFAKDPTKFLETCFYHLNLGGHVLVDWGLGDHWRFEKFKVGWIRDDEHEFASYAGKTQELYSCFWNEQFEAHPAAKDFSTNIQKFGYCGKRLTDYVLDEIPEVFSDLSRVECFDLMSLWPESPQLYICAVFV